MSKQNDQPVSRTELQHELKVLCQDLREELQIFGTQLAITITTTLSKELHAEFDRRFAESEARIITHVENLMAEQSLEITTAVANMIQPIQKSSHNHENRITHLEQKIA